MYIVNSAPCRYTRMQICTHTHMHIRTHTRAHTQTHIHTQHNLLSIGLSYLRSNSIIFTRSTTCTEFPVVQNVSTITASKSYTNINEYLYIYTAFLY